MLAASCQDTEFTETLDSSKAQVMFSLAMDSPSARSRSTWDDYKPTGLGNGTYYDNKIDYDQFIVKIEEKDGTTYNVTDIFKWKEGEPDEGKYNEYNFVGTVKTADGKNVGNLELIDAKISVYVNMGKDNIADTFEQGAEYIPMFGFHTANLKFVPGKREEVKTPIYLLRAMAKIEVALTEELDKEYNLAGVTLNHYNGTGYCLPKSTEILGAQNTLGMSTDGVFNEYQDAKTSLAFIPVEETSSYVVYLPEVAKNENLKIQVELLPEDAPEGTEPEVGSFNVMSYPENGDPEAINIVRNHWYKYTVSGFAASQIFVEYKTLDWQTVDIEIGGDGFLFLNKDVIEIYNSNIDADQLKFASSSPIKSIELKDLYTHANNGEIVEGTTDGVSAYYISKFGQKIQLGSKPGFDITDMDAALARELVILNNIKATAEADKLNGGITITSPFMADPASQVIELQQNSHYDTPRYLEFLVTNEQDLTATFRVIQYPPVKITNVEGYYSYRDDHKMTDDPTEQPVTLHNYKDDLYCVFITAFSLVHVHDFTNEPTTPEWDATPQEKRDYSFATRIGNTQESNDEDWEDLRYGLGGHTVTVNKTSYYYSGVYRANDKGAKPFYREYFKNFPSCASNVLKQGAPIGDPFTIEEDGKPKIYRKHYPWQAIPFYWPKFVGNYYEEDGTSVAYATKNSPRLKGQVDILEYGPSSDGGKTWGHYYYYGNSHRFVNHRMYNIQFTNSTNDYVIGYPELTEDGLTVNTVSNSNRVSPNIMIASQLGETYYENVYNYVKTEGTKYGYKLPSLAFYFEAAKRHCQNYVETSYKDENGNHQWDEGEEVTHYNDWRLPTKKEIDMIIDYQANSRAMDQLLTGQYYLCTTGKAGDTNSLNNGLTSSQVVGYTETGFYTRCVRDIKSAENDGIIKEK